MTKVLLTPGIGNQLFQVVAAANLRAHSCQPAIVAVSKRYLESKHGGLMVVDFPFISHVDVQSTSQMDDLAYFLWLRFGSSKFVQWISAVSGVWMECPLPRIDQHRLINLSKIKMYPLSCGYWQDFAAEVIISGLRSVIDIQQLNLVLSLHDVTSQNRIHVRAGDYKSAKIYTMLDENYYTECVIAAGKPHEKWEMVTDNPQDPRVQQIFVALKKKGVILDDILQINAEEDFLRLISAKTLICANSTFSVAAAYIRDLLNRTTNQTFVPATWFNTPSLKRPDFYANHWIVH
jgi:hypothetical protein